MEEREKIINGLTETSKIQSNLICKLVETINDGVTMIQELDQENEELKTKLEKALAEIDQHRFGKTNNFI